MALSAKVFSFTVSTGAVGTTFDVTGLTGIHSSSKFWALLWWSGRATTGFAEEDVRVGLGLLTGTASRRSYSMFLDHGSASEVSVGSKENDCCIHTVTTGPAIEGKCDLDSVITDGLRFIVDDQFVTAVVVGGIAVWGSDITDVGIVDFDSPTATGDDDASLNFGFALNTGIDDKAIITISNRNSSFGSAANIGALGLSVIAGDTIAQAAVGIRASHGVNPTTNNRACRTGVSINGMATVDQITHRASATAWLSTGARLNWAETALSTWNSSALAVKGGRYKVGDILSQTGTSNTDETVGIVPKGLFLFSAGAAESASDTSNAHIHISVGGATGAAERNVAFICDQDATTPADCGSGFQTDAFYGRIDVTNATKAVIGLADLVDLDASGGGFTFVMDDADPDQAIIPYLAIGETPVTTQYTNLERSTRGLLRGLAPMWR